MPEANNKRDNSDLSPPADNSKRYLLDTGQLIKINKYYVPQNAKTSQLIYQGCNAAPVKATPMDIQDEAASQETTKKDKIPPIYLHEGDYYQKVTEDIRSLVTDEFATACKGKFLRINLSNSDDYRKLTNFYDTNNLKYHTFRNPEDKANQLSVVIRSVSTSITKRNNDRVKKTKISSNQSL